MKTVYRYLLSVLLVLAATGFIGYEYAVTNILAYAPIRPHRFSRDEVARFVSRRADPGVFGLRFAPLNVGTDDAVVLKGWFIYAAVPTKPYGTLILLHGIGNCKESLLGMANTFARLGYNCILYDSRAHGESGGMYCTFGYYEKKDVSAVIDDVCKHFDSASPIGIYGHSLGAAVAIQAMAEDKRIRCGVVECPFATLREVVYDYWVRLSHVPLHFIPDQALENSERIAHFRVDSVKPEESARRIDQPVLIAHGEEDRDISILYGKRVFDNLRSFNKVWYPIPDADHNNVSIVGGARYFKMLTRFLKKGLPSQSQSDTSSHGPFISGKFSHD